jgi:hypothetical protein
MVTSLSRIGGNMSKFSLSAGVAVLALYAGHAMAVEIVLGNNTSGHYTFTGQGGGHIGVASAGLTGTSEAFFLGDTGNYVLGPTTFTTGPEINGIFAASGTESLSVTLSDSDTASGLVTWSQIKDGSLFPDFIGTWHITASSGDATWMPDFPASFTVPIDLVLTVPEFLSNLGSDTNADGNPVLRRTEDGTISSGEIIGYVGEPASLSILGVGLLAIGWLLRRRGVAGIQAA